MANFKVGTIALATTDAGTVTVSDVGFEPKAVIFWSCLDTKTTNVDGRPGIMVGATTGASSNWAAIQTVDDGDAAAWAYSMVATYCINTRGRANSNGGQYALSSFNGSGFVLAVTNPVAEDATVNYLAIGGSDVSAAAGIGTYATDTTPFTVSSLGFVPKFLMLGAGLVAVTSTDTEVQAGALALGFSDGTTSFYTGVGHANQATTNNKSRWGTAWVHRLYAQDSTQARTIAFTSFNQGSQGFTITPSSSGSASKFGWLALGGTFDVKVGVDAMETAGSPPVAFSQTGMSFKPGALLCLSSPIAVVDGTTYDNSSYTIGATDGVSQVWSSWYNADNLSAIDAYVANGTGDLLRGYQRDGADSFSLNAEVSFTSFNNDGFTLAQDDLAPVAGAITWIAFGGQAEGWLNTTRPQSLGRGMVSETASRLGGVLDY